MPELAVVEDSGFEIIHAPEDVSDWERDENLGVA
jgi:hypothetical protein